MTPIADSVLKEAVETVGVDWEATYGSNVECSAEHNELLSMLLHDRTVASVKIPPSLQEVRDATPAINWRGTEDGLPLYTRHGGTWVEVKQPYFSRTISLRDLGGLNRTQIELIVENLNPAEIAKLKSASLLLAEACAEAESSGRQEHLLAMTHPGNGQKIVDIINSAKLESVRLMELVNSNGSLSPEHLIDLSDVLSLNARLLSDIRVVEHF